MNFVDISEEAYSNSKIIILTVINSKGNKNTGTLNIQRLESQII
jgi:hypothetical protein